MDSATCARNNTLKKKKYEFPNQEHIHSINAMLLITNSFFRVEGGIVA